MATNPPKDNSRKGAVKNRTQVLNPKTGLYTKRNKDNGEFISVKVTGGKYKGVTDENKNGSKK